MLPLNTHIYQRNFLLSLFSFSLTKGIKGGSLIKNEPGMAKGIKGGSSIKKVRERKGDQGRESNKKVPGTGTLHTNT